MLKLICGPSGAGKTEYLTSCIEADIRAGVRSYLLIPEQQAYISERNLAERLPKNAGLFFEVVSFSGLAEKVFCRYGGVTAESVSSAVSSLLMWHTLATFSPLLQQYGKLAAGLVKTPLQCSDRQTHNCGDFRKCLVFEIAKHNNLPVYRRKRFDTASQQQRVRLRQAFDKNALVYVICDTLKQLGLL